MKRSRGNICKSDHVKLELRMKNKQTNKISSTIGALGLALADINCFTASQNSDCKRHPEEPQKHW